MTTTNFPGIEISDLGNCLKYACSDCGRYINQHGLANAERIRHARSCGSSAQPYEQVAVTATVGPGLSRFERQIARQGAISAIRTDDEIVNLVRSGQLSVDDAMNRDF